MSNEQAQAPEDTIEQLLSGDLAPEDIDDEGVVTAPDAKGATDPDADAGDGPDTDTDGDADTDDADTSDAVDDDTDTDAETDGDDGIDYDMMIPLGGREPVKLGEIKDAYQNLYHEKDQVDKQRMALVDQEQEVASFLRESGVEIPQQFRERIQRRQADYLREQAGVLGDMIPETKTDAGFNAVRDRVVRVARASNFTPKELSELADARVVHILNRLAVAEERLANLAKPRALPRNKAPRGKAATGKKLSKFDAALKSENPDAKADAINELLGVS